MIPLDLCAFDKWDDTEIAMEAAFVALTIVDWGQTLNMSDRHDDFRENNPMLGESPSRRMVNTRIPCAIVGQAIIAHILPSKWRKIWIGCGIVIEAAAIGRNYHVGLKASF